MDAERLVSALLLALFVGSIAGLVVLDRRIRLRLGNENTIRFVELGLGILGFLVGSAPGGGKGGGGMLAFVFGIELIILAIRKVPAPRKEADAATPSEGDASDDE